MRDERSTTARPRFGVRGELAGQLATYRPPPHDAGQRLTGRRQCCLECGLNLRGFHSETRPVTVFALRCRDMLYMLSPPSIVG